MIKELFYQEDIAVLNVYELNGKTLKNIMKNLIKLKGETKKLITTIGDFNIHISKIYRIRPNTHTRKHACTHAHPHQNQVIKDLKNTIEQLYLINWHLLNILSNNCTVAEYSFFSSANGTFINIH